MRRKDDLRFRMPNVDPSPHGASEQPKLFAPSTVIGQIQGRYLLDYALFTGTLREYFSAGLEAQFKTAPNDLHRRAFVLAVYREEYTAYEDLGAFIDALLSHADDSKALVLERILRYGPGKVRLSKVLTDRKITTGDRLFDALGLKGTTPLGWETLFPGLDLQKVLLRACFYVVDDCLRSQKNEGVFAFNKIKHAGVVVPDARRYVASLPNAPAAIYLTAPSDEGPQVNPVAIMAITMADDGIEERLKQIHFIQRTLRLLVLLFVLKHHQEEVAVLGVETPAGVFKLERLVDLRKFIEDLASTPWEPPNHAAG